MQTRVFGCNLLFIFLIIGLLGLKSAGWTANPQATHLIELSIAFGENHFDSSLNLVRDSEGNPEVPRFSLPYALALLEAGTSLNRAKAVLEACLAHQDMRKGSATYGQFRWYAIETNPYGPDTIPWVAPLLARAYTRHNTVLGADLTGKLQQAMSAALIGQGTRELADTDLELLRLSSAVVMSSALGNATIAKRAADWASRWCQVIAEVGRTWNPSPTGDVRRIMALQSIWLAAPEETRPGVLNALRLCYLDFTQRVQTGTSILAGAGNYMTTAEFAEGQGLVSYFIYRNFGLKSPSRVDPIATLVALSDFELPTEWAGWVQPVTGGYCVETNSLANKIIAQTVTFMHPQYSLGTMTGWCGPESIPFFATFSQYNQSPTAYAWIHGAPAYVSSFQFQNLAICSFNFDQLGTAKRKQSYINLVLGRAGEVDEVSIQGTEWNGEPIAVGSRGTVAVKRGNVYMAITLLDSGISTIQEDVRRKPGMLEWEGQGERARLTLTIYARQEDYPLKRPVDDWRAGFVAQMWTADQFNDLSSMVRWLNISKIAQTFQTSVTRTPLPQDLHPILDKGKLLPKPRVIKMENRLHTIEYAYERGRGSSYRLIEDIRNEGVRGRVINGQPIPEFLWWHSPRLYWSQKQAIEAAFIAGPPVIPEPAPTGVEEATEAVTDTPVEGTDAQPLDLEAPVEAVQ